MLTRTEKKKKTEQIRSEASSTISEAQRGFVVAPLKGVYQSAKARFIMRPDILKVKEPS